MRERSVRYVRSVFNGRMGNGVESPGKFSAWAGQHPDDSIFALALAFAIGAAIGLMATSGKKPLRFIARVYVEFIQNTPLLLQLCFCTTHWPLPA